MFVLPIEPGGWRGPVAPWITTAGWAAAARRVLGQSWIVTPGGVLDAEQAGAEASRPGLAPRAPAWWRRYVPEEAITLAKDIRHARVASGFDDAALLGPWLDADTDVAFVWQRHDLFHWAGIRAARALARPVVTFVAAPLVWEGQRWGVRRPGWGRVVERRGELRQLEAADLVACTSDEVADELADRGIARDRLAVTPAGVDIDRFHPSVDGREVRRRHDLEASLVVGWAGSFRRLHGLDGVLDAVSDEGRDRSDVALLLVGNGLERPRLEARAAELGIRAVFTGTVPYDEMPQHVAAMDVAVVSGSAEFHYSPLKLSEYLAAGRAVVGPAVGHVERLIADGTDGVLVPPGDRSALAAALRALLDDGDRRQSMGAAARETAVAHCSWDQRVTMVLDRFGAGGS